MRNIQAPGIELREIDRSQYNVKEDYSIVDTNCFFTGFASRGQDYTTNWINALTTFTEQYGEPKTEPELFLYNAVAEVLNKGGVALVSKLPYDNEAKDKYTYVDYDVKLTQVSNIDYENDKTISALYESVDSGLSHIIHTALDISTPTDNNVVASNSGKLTIDELDNLLTHPTFRSANNKETIRFVDISRSYYDKLESSEKILGYDDGNTIAMNDCLGIVPVIVSPYSALLQQYGKDMLFEGVNVFEACPAISSLGFVKPTLQNSNYWFTDLNGISNAVAEKFFGKKYDTTWSSDMTEYFPTIVRQYNGFDPKYFKSIGVVVLKLYKDVSGQIGFKILESFFGSLDKKNANENDLRYICNVVNEQSKFINMFTNISQATIDKAHIVKCIKQTVTSLGFYEQDCRKIISYEGSIVAPLVKILERNSNPNILPLDLVVDAGVSNIAQYVAQFGENLVDNDSTNSDLYLDFTNKPDLADHQSDKSCNDDDVNGSWASILKIFNDFCKYTRRDCMFIADGLRSLCLVGNEKLVRTTRLESSVEIDVIPKLHLMTKLNSNFAAGYCNWFNAQDAFGGRMLWLPPSIKACGVYVKTDAYYHPWDAPAGLNRGLLDNVFDVAFNPNGDESGKIYTQAWNYAVSYPLDGIALEGQKTFQLQPTALDRVNVRRLMLHIEKVVKRFAKHFVYEGNTPYMRQKFVDQVTEFLEKVKYGNGISEYAIRCDETNNTIETIENHELHCRIAVRPIKTIEFIVLDFITTNQSASVNEELYR